MAILGTYKILQSDIVPSQSGNAVIALYNKIGSGKRIYIKNTEIQNFRRDSIGANSRVTDFEIYRISAQSSGTELVPIKLDSNASNIPSEIKVFTDGNPTISTQSVTISTTTTLAFGIGPPGTITRAAGSWLTDGIIQGANVTISGSSSNNNTFTVRSTTATVITVETQQPVVTEGANASASATATIPISLGRFSIKHAFSAAATNGFMCNLNRGSKEYNWGSVYNAHANIGGTIESIWLAEGEGISVNMRKTYDLDAATDVKEFHSYMIEVLFSLDWSPDKTYFVSEIITPKGEAGNLISIMNNSGSGRNIKVIDITVSEIGDASTPYFMLVPIDSIESLSIDDTTRDLPYIKMDSNNTNIDSYVEIKKDVPLYPKGFSSGNALFPISFGSAVTANGLNYLITKDFLGPVFAVFFPEKSELAHNPTTAITNNFLSKSQRDSSIFTGSDLYLSEGEGIAIVAASEPLIIASGVAQQVNKFSTGRYDYGITFSVEDVAVSLTFTGLQNNSEIRIFEYNTTNLLGGLENTSTSWTYEYVYEPDTYIDVVIMHLDYKYYRIQNLLLSNTSSSIPVQQIEDRNYLNP